MKRQIIQTADAPKAIGPYSQAVRVGDTVYVSGQIPLDPVSGALVSGDIEAEVRRGPFGLELAHPDHRHITALSEPLPPTLTPIYPATAGLTQGRLRMLVA